MSANPVRRRRAPRGGNAKPIQVTLSQGERAAIEQLAELEQRSLAATARTLILRSLEAAPWPNGAGLALVVPKSSRKQGRKQ
jgi:hypothetical protein